MAKVQHGFIGKIRKLQYGGLYLRELWKSVSAAKSSTLHVTMPPHYRHHSIHHAKTHEWFYVLKGRTTVTIGGKPRKLRPGSFIYMAPGVPHLVKAGEEAVEVLVFFSPPMNIKSPDIVQAPSRGEAIFSGKKEKK